MRAKSRETASIKHDHNLNTLEIFLYLPCDWLETSSCWNVPSVMVQGLKLIDDSTRGFLEHYQNFGCLPSKLIFESKTQSSRITKRAVIFYKSAVCCQNETDVTARSRFLTVQCSVSVVCWKKYYEIEINRFSCCFRAVL